MCEDTCENVCMGGLKWVCHVTRYVLNDCVLVSP